MKIVTDKGAAVNREYDLLKQYPQGSDLDHLSNATLQRLILQLRQRHNEEMAEHRKVIREQDAQLADCLADNKLMTHDLDHLLNKQETDDGA